MASLSSPQKTEVSGSELDEMGKKQELSATSMESVASWAADPLKMRVLLTSWFSVTIEFFDFLLFGQLAGIVFDKLFFTIKDPHTSVVISYASYAMGFLTRPLGAIIFGHFGDTWGRKSTLIITLSLMGLSTVSIGLIPPYRAIGVWAPILMVICRALQGIALGGEWGGSMLLAFEHADRKTRALFTSIPSMGGASGLLLSAGTLAMLTAMPDSMFYSKGWRLAFLISGSLIALAFYIRTHLPESQEFAETASKRKESGEIKIPLIVLLRKHWKRVILGLGFCFIDGLYYNIVVVYGLHYAVKHVHLPKQSVYGAIALASLIKLPLVPIIGYWGDKFNKKYIYALGSVLTGASTYFTFAMLRSASADNIWPMYLGLLLPFGVGLSLIYGVNACIMSELFPCELRYTGISIVFQCSRIYSSGITPMVCTYLQEANGGGTDYVCLYGLIVGIFSAICSILLPGERIDVKELEVAAVEETLRKSSRKLLDAPDDSKLEAGISHGVEMMTTESKRGL